MTHHNHHKASQKYRDAPEPPAAPGNKRVRGKIWIEGEKGTYIGFGRVILLQRIKQFGSISKAARSMEMSYRHAWELVDSMNRQAGTPLVETATGGKGGGGARITRTGEAAIAAFWELYENFQQFLERQTEALHQS